jgi:hypothetical protein
VDYSKKGDLTITKKVSVDYSKKGDLTIVKKGD